MIHGYGDPTVAVRAAQPFELFSLMLFSKGYAKAKPFMKCLGMEFYRNFK